MQLGINFRTVLFVAVDNLFLIKLSLSLVALSRPQVVAICKPHFDHISNNYTCWIISWDKEEEMCSQISLAISLCAKICIQLKIKKPCEVSEKSVLFYVRSW